MDNKFKVKINIFLNIILMFIVSSFYVNPIFGGKTLGPAGPDVWSTDNIIDIGRYNIKIDVGTVNHFKDGKVPDEIYDIWTKPGLPYPWELTVEERKKLPPDEIVKRNLWGTGYITFCKNYYDNYSVLLIDRRGNIRTRLARRWNKSLFGREKDRLSDYVFVIIEPEDIRGVGYFRKSYTPDNKPDEMWFYLPSQRKIRRMTDASKQDTVAGSDLHLDDIYLRFGFYDWKIEGEMKNFKPPREDIFGISGEWPSTYINGMGREVWIISKIPKVKRWYYSKHLHWIDKENFFIYHSEKYDRKGKLIYNYQIPTVMLHGEPNQINTKPYYVKTSILQQIEDLRTGHLTICPNFTTAFDQNFDDSLFTTRTLLRGGIF